MSKYFAWTLSLLLHPLVIILGGTVLAAAQLNPQSLVPITLYLSLLLGIYVLIIVWGIKRQWFSDLDIINRQQRYWSHFLSLILGGCYVAGMYVIGAASEFIILTLILLLTLLLVWLANFFIKASAHLAFLTIFILLLIKAYNNYMFASLLVLVPALAWSRIVLKRHTLQETVVGTLLALIAYCFGVIVLF